MQDQRNASPVQESGTPEPQNLRYIAPTGQTFAQGDPPSRTRWFLIVGDPRPDDPGPFQMERRQW